MAYEVVSSKKVYSGKIIDVVQDVITLPDGREAVRELVCHGGAACVLAVDELGHILFVEQYRHPAGALTLEIPAGTLEKDEDPYDCACRELEEETGFRASKLTFMMKFYSAIGFCTEVLHIYLATGLLKGVQHLDPDEFVTLYSYSVDDVTAMISSGKIVDSKTIAAVLMYKEMLAQNLV